MNKQNARSQLRMYKQRRTAKRGITLERSVGELLGGLEGNTVVLKNVSEKQGLDTQCFLMQTGSKSDEKKISRLSKFEDILIAFMGAAILNI